MGLLDILDSDQGRLGVGLLAAAGPSMTPMGFGQRLQQGLGYVQHQRDADMQSKLRQVQLDESMAQAAARRAALDRQNQMQALAGQFAIPARPVQGPTDAVNGALPPDMQIGAQPAIPAKPAGFDFGGYANALARIDPMASLNIQQALQKENPVNKLDVKDFTPASVAKFTQTKNYADLVRMDKLHFADTGGAVTAMDQFTGKPVTATPVTGNKFKDLLVAGPDGKLIPNNPLIQAKSQVASAGAPRTDVRIDNKMGEGIAAQVGPILKDSLNAANGAAQQVDAAKRIVQAIDSGKVISGPGANIRIRASQLGQMLGITGKSEAETIAKTRDVIRGLSEMTLQGRKQMTGQGAITENEGALAEKANSGRIEDLTPAEIRQLAKASARAAKFIYGQHQDKVKELADNPNTVGLSKFYKPAPMIDFPDDAAPASSGVDSLVDKYRSR